MISIVSNGKPTPESKFPGLYVSQCQAKEGPIKTIWLMFSEWNGIKVYDYMGNAIGQKHDFSLSSLSWVPFEGSVTLSND